MKEIFVKQSHLYIYSNQASSFVGKEKKIPPAGLFVASHLAPTVVVFSISSYSDIILDPCCPSVYLRVSVTAACSPVDCLWDGRRDADTFSTFLYKLAS